MSDRERNAWSGALLPQEGEPCAHPSCLSHVTHPCEGCGRIAGRSTVPTSDSGSVGAEGENYYASDDWTLSVAETIIGKIADKGKYKASGRGHRKNLERTVDTLRRLRHRLAAPPAASEVEPGGDEAVRDLEAIERITQEEGVSHSLLLARIRTILHTGTMRDSALTAPPPDEGEPVGLWRSAGSLDTRWKDWAPCTLDDPEWERISNDPYWETRVLFTAPPSPSPEAIGGERKTAHATRWSKLSVDAAFLLASEEHQRLGETILEMMRLIEEEIPVAAADSSHEVGDGEEEGVEP